MNLEPLSRWPVWMTTGVFVAGFVLGGTTSTWWSRPENNSVGITVAAGSSLTHRSSGGRPSEDDPRGNGVSGFSEAPVEETAVALARLARVRSPETRYRAFRDYGAAMAKASDRAALLEAFKQIRAAADATEFITACLETLGAQAPREGLLLAESLPPSPARSNAFVEALSQLSATEPVFAIAEARRLLRGSDRNNALMSIGQGWGRTNPVEGLNWALQNTDGDLRSQMVETISAQWAMTNPEAAAAHLDSARLDPELRLLATSAVMGTWSQTDPVQAVAQAARSSATLGSARPLEIAFLNWGSYAPQDAAQALLARNDAELTGGVAPSIATHWALNEPEAAFSFAANLADPAGRAETISSVLESWAEYAPQQALTAALQLPSADGARESAVNTALGQFLAGNPEDFTQLVAQMPAGFRAELTQRERAFREGKAPLAAQP